jgi:hypothetical protein
MNITQPPYSLELTRQELIALHKGLIQLHAFLYEPIPPTTDFGLQSQSTVDAISRMIAGALDDEK